MDVLAIRGGATSITCTLNCWLCTSFSIANVGESLVAWFCNTSLFSTYPWCYRSRTTCDLSILLLCPALPLLDQAVSMARCGPRCGRRESRSPRSRKRPRDQDDIPTTPKHPCIVDMEQLTVSMYELRLLDSPKSRTKGSRSQLRREPPRKTLFRVFFGGSPASSPPCFLTGRMRN